MNVLKSLLCLFCFLATCKSQTEIWRFREELWRKIDRIKNELKDIKTEREKTADDILISCNTKDYFENTKKSMRQLLIKFSNISIELNSVDHFVDQMSSRAPGQKYSMNNYEQAVNHIRSLHSQLDTTESNMWNLKFNRQMNEQKLKNINRKLTPRDFQGHLHKLSIWGIKDNIDVFEERQQITEVTRVKLDRVNKRVTGEFNDKNIKLNTSIFNCCIKPTTNCFFTQVVGLDSKTLVAFDLRNHQLIYMTLDGDVLSRFLIPQNHGTAKQIKVINDTVILVLSEFKKYAFIRLESPSMSIYKIVYVDQPCGSATDQPPLDFKEDCEESSLFPDYLQSYENRTSSFKTFSIPQWLSWYRQHLDRVVDPVHPGIVDVDVGNIPPVTAENKLNSTYAVTSPNKTEIKVYSSQNKELVGSMWIADKPISIGFLNTPSTRYMYQLIMSTVAGDLYVISVSNN